MTLGFGLPALYRAVAAIRVANPRHKVVYQLGAGGDVEILAVVGVSLPSWIGPER